MGYFDKVLFVLLLVILSGCSSNESSANIVQELNIYSEPNTVDSSENISHPDENGLILEEHEINESNETIYKDSPLNSTIEITEEKEAFKFNPASIVNTQNGVSFSLDDIKHEVKNNGEWAKITDIYSTVYNEGHEPFKPKVVVRIYDSDDPKDEKFRPKAEFDFGIELLKKGEHATIHAIVNAPFRDLNQTKKLELVLMNGAVTSHSSIAYIEMDYKI